MTAKTSCKLIITCVRQQAAEIRSFDLLPAAAESSHDIAFRPGQVAILGVDGHEPAYFAFAGSPEDPELEILVKRTIGPSVALFEMKEGAAVDLLGVAGHGFDLNGQAGRDLVFVAMGTGVAPLRSALRYVLERREEFGQLMVLYGARTPDEFCYRDEIDEWKRPESNCVK